MPSHRIVWTSEMDDELRRLRADRSTYPGTKAVAKRLGVAACVMQRRVRELGLPQLPRGNRPNPDPYR